MRGFCAPLSQNVFSVRGLCGHQFSVLLFASCEIGGSLFLNFLAQCQARTELLKFIGVCKILPFVLCMPDLVSDR